jgi:uncharacterized protein (TIGR02145 family)
LFWGCVSISFFGEDAIETCDGEKYRTREQICEDGVLKNLCGNGYYDPKMQFCFDDAVFEKCADKEYNPLNQKCESSIVFNKCGNGYYNPAMQFCSEQEIYKKCDGKEYNLLNQKCEDDILLSMCGENYYNPLDQNQKCENNILMPKCRNDYYNPSNQKCEDDILLSMCGEDYYNPLDQNQRCENNILMPKCGNDYYNPSNQKCENGILEIKCGNEWYNPFSEYCFEGIVKDNDGQKLIFDNREGKTYKYTVIGSQIWMAENLQYETLNAKCYNDNPDNCEIYGMMYDWNEANTACPYGWHLPNDAEWNALKNFAGDDVGIKLKANNNIWISGKGTDDFGFTALPGGLYRTDDSYKGEKGFGHIGELAAFWSATAGARAGSAHVRILNNLLSLDGFYINRGLAYVRCIKD